MDLSISTIMVKLDKIYTRGGDAGLTSLGDGTRVPKHALRVAAYGAIDEANASIGVARLHTDGKVDSMLAQIQNDLFDLGADLCVPVGEEEKPALRVNEQQVGRLEQEIDLLNAELPPLSSFVLPGGLPPAAYLHMARTSVRRAERLIFELNEEEQLTPQVLAYINRLSDHLFVCARYVNNCGQADVLWEPGKNQ